MAELLTTENLIALVTLTALEIVLGIDNIVFIAILAGRLPEAQRAKARRIGLLLAMFTRIALLLTLSWMMSLTQPLFHVPLPEAIGERLQHSAPPAVAEADPSVAPLTDPTRHPVSGKDLILLLGGLFLIWKATHEIHGRVEGGGDQDLVKKSVSTFGSVIAQIVVIDIVFSLDSVITAVGMAQSIYVMVAAVVIAIGVMLAFAGRISGFIERHPTMKMLALAFLLLIGVVLVADGVGQHIQKGYIYFAMAFSLGVELLNLRTRKHAGNQRPAISSEPLGD